MAIEKNHLAEAKAYKVAVAKSKKINEHNIAPDMSKEEQDKLVELLARNKADNESTKWTDEVKGQRWYVEDLMKFSALKAQERLDKEYADAFANVSNEDEKLESLEALMSAA